MPIALALCLFGPTSWLPASVPADPGDIAPRTRTTKPRIAIAPIVYSTTIPEHTKVAVHATVTEAVQSMTRSALLLDVDAECRTRQCALRQARDADAELLLELTLTLDQRDYAIEVVVLAADDGRQLTESSGECRLCAQAELLVEIAAQLTSLEAAIEREPAHSPPHAGSPAPELAPARSPIAGAEVRSRRLEIGGWIGFALGLAGVGAGAALLAIDGREHGPTCGVADRDVHGACPNVYTTQLAGIVSVSAGAVALASGAGLLIAGKARRERGAAARLTPAPGGLRLSF